MNDLQQTGISFCYVFGLHTEGSSQQKAKNDQERLRTIEVSEGGKINRNHQMNIK